MNVRDLWQLGGAKAAPPYPSPTSGVGWRHGITTFLLPTEGSLDTASLGDATGNSAVFALLYRKAKSFAEPPVEVFDVVDGEPVIVADHPVSTLLRHPNEVLDGTLLWQYVIAATEVEGNAYLLKGRSASGRVVELWPLDPTLTSPGDATTWLGRPEDEGQLISHYEYRASGVPQRFERDDVIHLRQRIHPADPRRGVGSIATVLKDLIGDEQAPQYVAAILRNMGMPGVIISPADPTDPGPSPDEVERMTDQWSATFGGRNRGRPFFIRGGAVRVDTVSFSPDKLDLRNLRRIPEERASAVLEVPAILAHLGAGLDRATYSNAATLRDMFTEDTLAPLWRTFGAQLTHQLLPDFDTSTTRRIAFDLSGVRALQDDHDALWKRVDMAVRGGWITVADARRIVGLDATPDDEVYLRSVSTIETGPGATVDVDRALARVGDGD